MPPSFSETSLHTRSRRGPARAIAILLGIAVIGLGARILLTPVDVTVDVTITFDSVNAPVEIYLGDHRLGETPVEIDISFDHPGLVDVDPEYNRTTLSAHRMLLAVGVEDFEVLGSPNALPKGATNGGIAGQVMLVDSAAGKVDLLWWKAMVRRPDGTLEIVYPWFVDDEPSGVRRGGLLRIRRGDEVTLDAFFGRKTAPAPGLAERVLRRAHYESNAVISAGAVHDPERLEGELGDGEWWLGRFDPGIELLGKKE